MKSAVDEWVSDKHRPKMELYIESRRIQHLEEMEAALHILEKHPAVIAETVRLNAAIEIYSRNQKIQETDK